MWKELLTINNIKDLFNIIFFITMGTVSVLSYQKAKKTILQPMRNEVFKQQLDIFQEIMELFNGKSETELREFFGIREMVNINISLLFDSYIISELGYRVTGERPHDIDNCPRAMITQKFAEKNFEIINSDINLENDNNKTTAKQKLDWEDYYHGEIKVPEKTWEALRILDRLIKSPLLPKKCITYLSKIKRTLHNNIDITSDVLTEVAKELPKKYPDKDSIIKADTSWIWNRYNKKINNFEPHADDLTDYLRDYLTIETLLEE